MATAATASTSSSAAGLTLGRIPARELEFFAEESLVMIVPRFTHPRLRFVGGNYGPFEVHTPVEVPLWLSLAMRKTSLCRIQAPDWMDVDSLRQRRAEELANAAHFSDVPPHYAEIAALLLTHAKEDIDSADEVRTLLEDIENCRSEKIRNGIQSIADNFQDGDLTESVTMPNVGAMEILGIRGFLTESMARFAALSATAADIQGIGSQPPVGAATGAAHGPTPATPSAHNFSLGTPGMPGSRRARQPTGATSTSAAAAAASTANRADTISTDIEREGPDDDGGAGGSGQRGLGGAEIAEGEPEGGPEERGGRRRLRRFRS